MSCLPICIRIRLQRAQSPPLIWILILIIFFLILLLSILFTLVPIPNPIILIIVNNNNLIILPIPIRHPTLIRMPIRPMSIDSHTTLLVIIISHPRSLSTSLPITIHLALPFSFDAVRALSTLLLGFGVLLQLSPVFISLASLRLVEFRKLGLYTLAEGFKFEFLEGVKNGGWRDGAAVVGLGSGIRTMKNTIPG